VTYTRGPGFADLLTLRIVVFFEVLDEMRLTIPRTLESSLFMMKISLCSRVYNTIEVIHKKSTLLLIFSLIVITPVILGLLNLYKKVLLNMPEVEKLRGYWKKIYEGVLKSCLVIRNNDF
jgi:hypothetical protein